MGSAPNSAASVHLLPQTPAGWWSVRLLLAGVALLVANVLIVEVGNQSGGSNPWIMFTIIPAGVAVVAAGIAAAVAIVRVRERGVLTVIPLLIGFLVVWFVIGEAVTPH